MTGATGAGRGRIERSCLSGCVQNRETANPSEPAFGCFFAPSVWVPLVSWHWLPSRVLSRACSHQARFQLRQQFRIVGGRQLRVISGLLFLSCAVCEKLVGIGFILPGIGSGNGRRRSAGTVAGTMSLAGFDAGSSPWCVAELSAVVVVGHVPGTHLLDETIGQRHRQ